MDRACPARVPPTVEPTLGARVYEALRAALVGGAFSPGDKLSLRTIAERLGVSMQPVRQAVARLVADQALEVAPNRAVRVPVMSLARFEELTEIRVAIESFAARTAALRIGARSLAEVRRHDRAFRRQCRSRTPDVEAAVQANYGLHFATYRAAAMPSLMPIIEGLWLRIGPVLNLDMRESPRRLALGEAEACHAALVAALASRAAPAAGEAIEADIRTAARFIATRGILTRHDRPTTEGG
ncbi:MAG: GntR family transcriptional regulator [Lautropia sp.]